MSKIKKQIIISVIASIVGVGIIIAFNLNDIAKVVPLIILIVAINIMASVTTYFSYKEKKAFLAMSGIVTGLLGLGIVMTVLKLL